jgi:hypothetical protein
MRRRPRLVVLTFGVALGALIVATLAYAVPGRGGSITATTTWTLSVSKDGSGTGTVTSDVQPGIDCGGTCSAAFDDGTALTLTATPDAGSRFVGWSGDTPCSGTGPGSCALTMNSDRSVTATFVRLRTVTVSLTGGGTGSVTIQPGAIVCTSTCSATFDDSTQVTLTASPAAGEVFTGWSADCSGTDT